MEECLKKGADARKFSIALTSCDYSGDLIKQLQSFSTKMETVWGHMRDLRRQGIKEEKQYNKFFRICDEKILWYTKAEASYHLMQS